MTTLKQLYREKLERDTMKIWTPATLDLQAIINTINEANKEWLTQKRHNLRLYKHVLLKSEFEIRLNQFNELLEELKQ